MGWEDGQGTSLAECRRWTGSVLFFFLFFFPLFILLPLVLLGTTKENHCFRLDRVFSLVNTFTMIPEGNKVKIKTIKGLDSHRVV